MKSQPVITPPVGGPPPHFHDKEAEWFYVLEGRVSFFNGEQWTEVAPCGAVFVPKNAVHTFKNVGDKPSRVGHQLGYAAMSASTRQTFSGAA